MSEEIKALDLQTELWTNEINEVILNKGELDNPDELMFIFEDAHVITVIGNDLKIEIG